MDNRAESGDAAHTAYKGGLNAPQACLLQAWTHELHHRLAGRQQAKLMLPASGSNCGTNGEPMPGPGIVLAYNR